MRVLEQRRARNRRQEVHTQALRRDHVHERVGAGGVRVVAALGDVLPHGLGLHVEGAQHAGVHHHAGRAVGAEEGASKLAVRGEEVVDVLLRRRVAVIASPRRMNAPSPRPSRRARGTRMREAGSLFSSVRGFLPAPPPAGGPDAS